MMDSCVEAIVSAVRRRKASSGQPSSTLARAKDALQQLRHAARGNAFGVAPASLSSLLACLRTTDAGAIQAVLQAACILAEGGAAAYGRKIQLIHEPIFLPKLVTCLESGNPGICKDAAATLAALLEDNNEVAELLLGQKGGVAALVRCMERTDSRSVDINRLALTCAQSIVGSSGRRGMLAFAQHPHFAMRACGLFRRLDPACIRAAAALLLAILRDEVCAQPLLASLGTAEAERELSHAFDELLANAQEHGSAKRASGSGNESEEEEEEEEEEEGGGGDRGDREWAQALLLAVRFVREATAHCFRGPDVLQPMNIGTVVTWASQSDVVYDLASIALGRFLVLGSDSEGTLQSEAARLLNAALVSSAKATAALAESEDWAIPLLAEWDPTGSKAAGEQVLGINAMFALCSCYGSMAEEVREEVLAALLRCLKSGGSSVSAGGSSVGAGAGGGGGSGRSWLFTVSDMLMRLLGSHWPAEVEPLMLHPELLDALGGALSGLQALQGLQARQRPRSSNTATSSSGGSGSNGSGGGGSGGGSGGSGAGSSTAGLAVCRASDGLGLNAQSELLMLLLLAETMADKYPLSASLHSKLLPGLASAVCLQLGEEFPGGSSPLFSRGPKDATIALQHLFQPSRAVCDSAEAAHTQCWARVLQHVPWLLRRSAARLSDHQAWRRQSTQERAREQGQAANRLLMMPHERNSPAALNAEEDHRLCCALLGLVVHVGVLLTTEQLTTLMAAVPAAASATAPATASAAAPAAAQAAGVPAAPAAAPSGGPAAPAVVAPAAGGLDQPGLAGGQGSGSGGGGGSGSSSTCAQQVAAYGAVLRFLEQLRVAIAMVGGCSALIALARLALSVVEAHRSVALAAVGGCSDAAQPAVQLLQVMKAKLSSCLPLHQSATQSAQQSEASNIQQQQQQQQWQQALLQASQGSSVAADPALQFATCYWNAWRAFEPCPVCCAARSLPEVRSRCIQQAPPNSSGLVAAYESAAANAESAAQLAAFLARMADVAALAVDLETEEGHEGPHLYYESVVEAKRPDWVVAGVEQQQEQQQQQQGQQEQQQQQQQGQQQQNQQQGKPDGRPLDEQRKCAVCGRTRADGALLRRCKGCGSVTGVRYCSQKCCRDHWVYQGHRKQCEAAQQQLREQAAAQAALVAVSIGEGNGTGRN